MKLKRKELEELVLYIANQYSDIVLEDMERAELNVCARLQKAGYLKKSTRFNYRTYELTPLAVSLLKKVLTK